MRLGTLFDTAIFANETKRTRIKFAVLQIQHKYRTTQIKPGSHEVTAVIEGTDDNMFFLEFEFLANCPRYVQTFWCLKLSYTKANAYKILIRCLRVSGIFP